ncbi:Cdc42 like protein [Argiope bruennichi]|uniref:Cdc42 like protein n=1 Tax=Argiope bruennichi TaxID=94029 RepID=A0A8T0ED99_ARGBR|nr:Cdc42 like protein [Argiope bruennichi]
MSPKKETIKKIKCHVVGDIGIGKTSLLLAYEKKRFPTEIELRLTCFPYPRFANTVVKYESSNVYLWDYMEYDEFTELRKLGYLDTHWLPEITFHCPGTPYILIGTQIDLRRKGTMVLNNQKPITYKEGKKLAAKLKAVKYLECSALTQEGMQDLVKEVVLVARTAPKKK